MPFIVIRGAFHLLNQTSSGNLTGFEPDGDSMQFKPANPSLLSKLTQLSQPFHLTKIGSVQLRFEGIDALELHYNPTHGGPRTHQPRPLADDSRDFLTKALGLDPVTYAPPTNLRVRPPAVHDGSSGYILSRSLEVHGRPVSFVFFGKPPAKDGQEINLTPALLKRSVNYKSLLNGFSYPLFYDTLFKDLREVLAQAAQAARKNKLGLWAKDTSQTGVKITSQADLETKGIIFPKLFRRLTDYLAEGNSGLGGFLSFLQKKKEQVQDLDPNSPTFTNFTHFDNVVRVKNGKVGLRQLPETLVFVSEK
jgi:endonuclease YncB( thermonuclease family)